MNVDSEPAPTVVTARPVGVWRQRNFRAMWSAHTVSQFGTQITFFVVPVLALTTLSASTGQLGLISALETLPFLLFGLPAGALLDRWDRRRVMVAADIGRAAAIALLPIGPARDCALQALRLAETYGFRLCEADSLLILARTQSARGASAHDFARRALTIHQQNGHRLGERQALALLEEWGAVVMPNRLTALIPGPARHPAPSAGVRVPRRRAPGLRLGEAS